MTETLTHIEAPISDNTEEIVRIIFNDEWKTLCGMPIGVHTDWIDSRVVEEAEKEGFVICRKCREGLT